MWEVLLNGVDVTEKILIKSIRIPKDGAVEECTLSLLDWDLTSTALRIKLEDRLRLSWAGALEFGGEVDGVTDERLDGNDGGGTVTKARARGWAFQARGIVIDLAIGDTTLYDAVYPLFLTHLAPKGWTWIGPTTGGPDLKARRYEKQSLEFIFNDFQKDTGYPWRVNGDQWFAFSEPGAIPGPTALTVDNDTILLGMSVQGDLTRRITRAFVQVAVPKTGPGPVAHHEDHTADGVKTVFPVNVEPGLKVGSINAPSGATAGTTALAMDGLFPSAELLAGDTFEIETHPAPYTVTAPVTSDSDGKYGAVAFTPGLSADIEDNTPVLFAAKTYVRAKVNGVDVALFGTDWDWDVDQNALVTGGPAPSGTVTYAPLVLRPAWVRSWTAAAQLASGAFNAAVIQDGIIDAPHLDDFEPAKRYLDGELDRREVNRTITLRTFEHGFYPWQKVAVSHPHRLITGDWFLVSMVTRDIGRQDEVPHRDLTLVQVAERARFYYDFFREGRGGGGGGSTSGGGSAGPLPGGGSSGLPVGFTIHLGGANIATALATTVLGDVAEAIPTRFGGAAYAGTWRVRVPMYQLAAGTLEVHLLDQAAPLLPLAILSTTAVGAYVDRAFFDFVEVDITAPASPVDLLPQQRVTAGSREVCVGHITLVKLT